MAAFTRNASKVPAVLLDEGSIFRNVCAHIIPRVKIPSLLLGACTTPSYSCF